VLHINAISPVHGAACSLWRFALPGRTSQYSCDVRYSPQSVREAGAYASGGNQVAINRFTPAYYVELRALDVARDEINLQTCHESRKSDTPCSIRPWPFRLPPQQIMNDYALSSTVDGLSAGAILDFFA
jgi:hypothetical protein